MNGLGQRLSGQREQGKESQSVLVGVAVRENRIDGDRLACEVTEVVCRIFFSSEKLGFCSLPVVGNVQEVLGVPSYKSVARKRNELIEDGFESGRGGVGGIAGGGMVDSSPGEGVSGIMGGKYQMS